MCCDFCITCTPTLTPPPSWWPLFISYKQGLKESNSEEVRLHSEEMGKLKWAWDWTQPGSQLHLAARAVLLGKCNDPEQQLLPALLVAGGGEARHAAVGGCNPLHCLWAASLPRQLPWAQLPSVIKGYAHPDAIQPLTAMSVLWELPSRWISCLALPCLTKCSPQAISDVCFSSLVYRIKHVAVDWE